MVSLPFKGFWRVEFFSAAQERQGPIPSASRSQLQSSEPGTREATEYLPPNGDSDIASRVGRRRRDGLGCGSYIHSVRTSVGMVREGSIPLPATRSNRTKDRDHEQL
jgi:hypothetical protein